MCSLFVCCCFVTTVSGLRLSFRCFLLLFVLLAPPALSASGEAKRSCTGKEPIELSASLAMVFRKHNFIWCYLLVRKRRPFHANVSQALPVGLPAGSI